MNLKKLKVAKCEEKVSSEISEVKEGSIFITSNGYNPKSNPGENGTFFKVIKVGKLISLISIDKKADSKGIFQPLPDKETGRKVRKKPRMSNGGVYMSLSPDGGAWLEEFKL
jgi:hypothetical protein